MFQIIFQALRIQRRETEIQLIIVDYKEDSARPPATQPALGIPKSINAYTLCGRLIQSFPHFFRLRLSSGSAPASVIFTLQPRSHRGGRAALTSTWTLFRRLAIISVLSMCLLWFYLPPTLSVYSNNALQ